MGELRTILSDKELINYSKILIEDFCKKGLKSNLWTMRIPAEPNRDPDLIFSELIARFKKLCTPQFPDPCSVEQYEQITGEKLSKQAYVFMRPKKDCKRYQTDWSLHRYSDYTELEGFRIPDWYCIIVQTGKPAPGADWRPEDKVLADFDIRR